MYKRSTQNRNGGVPLISDSRKLEKTRKHPIQQITSTLPQLSVTFTILFYFSTSGLFEQ